LSADRPLVILSGNSIDHGLLALAAMHAGIPYAPVAPAYSLVARDHATLRAVWAAMTPGLVFAADGGEFARALDAVAAPDLEIVTTRDEAALEGPSSRDVVRHAPCNAGDVIGRRGAGAHRG
jgi:feruloyl-CoA synthase